MPIQGGPFYSATAWTSSHKTNVTHSKKSITWLWFANLLAIFPWPADPLRSGFLLYRVLVPPHIYHPELLRKEDGDEDDQRSQLIGSGTCQSSCLSPDHTTPDESIPALKSVPPWVKSMCEAPQNSFQGCDQILSVP